MYCSPVKHCKFHISIIFNVGYLCYGEIIHWLDLNVNGQITCGSENNSSLCSWMLINFALDKFILGPNV